MNNDEDFASNYSRKRDEENGNDVNKDGIVDGSPESIKKLGEDIGKSIAGFFEGLLGGFMKSTEEDLKKEEETANTSAPQVLNEEDKK